MIFRELITELEKGKTFEQICKEQEKNFISCKGNKVYLDDYLKDFLKELGVESYKITNLDLGSKWLEAVIDFKTGVNSVFIAPCWYTPNRFDNTLSDEILVEFDIKAMKDLMRC